VDVRVIAATNKNLEAGIRENIFRQDLYCSQREEHFGTRSRIWALLSRSRNCLHQLERDLIEEALREHGGNKQKITEVLGLRCPGFFGKLKRLGMKT
jgi:DNA-binding NtrC family response regulator